MAFKIFFFIFITIFTLVQCDGEISSRLCYPNEETRKKLCDCVSESNPPWGTRALRIDCSFRELTSKDFDMNIEVLPLYTDVVDISWNRLDYVQGFTSESLRLFNAAHNNISAINEKNFDKLPNLRELDLSWNAIQLISINAFAGLKTLTVLNLSHNNLKKLNFNIFSYLVSLESLNLSWNRNMNNSEGILELDIYSLYGLNPKLKTLNLEKCNLNNTDLSQGTGLEHLNLRGNTLEQIPVLPTGIKFLDLSDNPLLKISPLETLHNLTKLENLLLEDMPTLRSIDQENFSGLTKLKNLSIQNSRKITSFHQYAFGQNRTNSSLEILNLSGTMIKTFNSTLLPFFANLKDLNLKGIPLNCDCDLAWLKDLKTETSAHCFKPYRLRGIKLSTVHGSDFSCNHWPRWVYGIMILGLIVLCGGGIWLIVMGLRPFSRTNMRNNRVGANSPYARVTIEPSRLENNYY